MTPIPSECHPDKAHYARGKCKPCYNRALRAGEFGKNGSGGYRRNWDFVEDYEFVKATHGGTQEAIAARLGMTRNDLNQRLMRRRKWGQL